MQYYPIEIIEGYQGHEYTGILPVRPDIDAAFGLRENKQEEFSVVNLFLNTAFLGHLLRSFYRAENQPEDNRYGYDPYGTVLYSQEDMRALLSELAAFVEAAENDPKDPCCENFFAYSAGGRRFSAKETRERKKGLLDFYPRFIARMQQMLANMEADELVAFIGP